MIYVSTCKIVIGTYPADAYIQTELKTTRWI